MEFGVDQDKFNVMLYGFSDVKVILTETNIYNELHVQGYIFFMLGVFSSITLGHFLPEIRDIA